MSPAFEFTPENLERFEEILGRYPQKRAAMLPTLHLAHQQQGLITPEIEQYVARILEVPLVDVHEVLTFYTLFFRRPMGRHHIRLCMSISCWIRGASQVKDCLARTMGVASGEITPDGSLSWEAVPDCLGACELAPMMQLDKDYHGNLTPERINSILAEASGNHSSPDPETLRETKKRKNELKCPSSRYYLSTLVIPRPRICSGTLPMTATKAPVKPLRRRLRKSSMK